MPSCLKGSFLTVFSAFSEGLGKNAKVQLKLSHHQRQPHSGNESRGGVRGCEKFLGRVTVWTQPPAAKSQEDHPRVPRLGSGDAPVSVRGRQDGLNPRKSGLESDIHCSTQSPSGDSPRTVALGLCARLRLEPQPSGSELWLWGAPHYKSRPTETELPAGEKQIRMERASSALSEPTCSQLCWASGRSFCSRAWCSEGCAAVRCRRQASAGERHEEGRPRGGVTEI